MATYFGDATLTRVDRITGSRSPGTHGTTTLYTAPAGTYAEIFPVSGSVFAAVNESAAIQAGPWTILSVSNNDSGSIDSSQVYKDLPRIIDAGDTVTISTADTGGGGTPGSSVSFSFTVKEYNKP